MNPKATKILTSYFWSSNGWKAEANRSLSKEDQSFAKSHGVMFDSPHWTHDEVIEFATGHLQYLDVQSVANAFVTSLETDEKGTRNGVISSLWDEKRGHIFIIDKARSNRLAQTRRTPAPVLLQVDDVTADLFLSQILRILPEMLIQQPQCTVVSLHRSERHVPELKMLGKELHTIVFVIVMKRVFDFVIRYFFLT